ncbi:MAG TPA: hypothetical protein VLA47_00360 [Nitrospira sp.]|nr:hypothetical protein [Nitrospira sp.]
MPTIWCAISGHGFGHAAQVVPVLNELGRRLPSLAAVLRTTVSSAFFHDRLTLPWSRQSVQQDVGCVQHGPLEIDVQATWDHHRQFHATWDARLAAEKAAMVAASPSVILSDTSYLALSAGKQARIPSVLLASLTWSEILRSLDESAIDHALLESIELAYQDADAVLRMAPGLPLTGMTNVVDIGPIAEPAPSQRAELRSQLNVSTAERLVLVGFGGIPLDTLPWDRMERMKGYRFLVDGMPPRPSSRIHSFAGLPFSFKTALASVDVVMTKPGYGTIVETVASGVPVVYVRRYNFAEEAPLVEFLHRYGAGCELTRRDFLTGNWLPALEALPSGGPAGHPRLTGAADAAQLLLNYFQ